VSTVIVFVEAFTIRTEKSILGRGWWNETAKPSHAAIIAVIVKKWDMRDRKTRSEATTITATAKAVATQYMEIIQLAMSANGPLRCQFQ
jgi:hypothetical protein